MGTILALPHLYDLVVARFADEGTSVPNLFGWRAPDLKDHAGKPRIAWVPGDDESGELGELGAPKQPGRNPRSLATLGEIFTVRLWGEEPSDPENERKQYQAARELFDAWWRAVYLAMPAKVTVVSTEWLIDKKLRRSGAAIRVVCIIEAMVHDEALEVVATGASADIDTTELDNTESDSISAGA
jgi:hypothetical protein